MSSKLVSFFAVALLAGATGLVQAQTAVVAEAKTPEHTLTGNLALTTDYRFRGISQTWRLPAVQGGFDYAHASGVYLGAWASNVSGNSYNNGAGLELDLYGGYKLALTPDLTLDLGALAYLYPGARLNSAPGVATGKKYDNIDVYAALAIGGFSGKLSVAATDYFGLNSDTAGYAYFNSLAARGASKGSTYLDLNYKFDLGNGLSLDTHLGHLSVRRYGELSYTDLKLGLSKEMVGLNWSAALIGSNAKKAFYQAGNAAGTDAKRLGTTTLVLGVSRGF